MGPFYLNYEINSKRGAVCSSFFLLLVGLLFILFELVP